MGSFNLEAGGDIMNSQTIQSSVKLFPISELMEGERQLVEIDGVEIALFNVDGNLYAIANKCPHQGVPMVYGSIGGRSFHPTLKNMYMDFITGLLAARCMDGNLIWKRVKRYSHQIRFL